MVLVQLLPSIVLSPFIGALADRRRPSRMLCASYALQAASMGAVAVVIYCGVPVAAVFALAPLTALGFTMTRPPQAALLPAVVRTPGELTAANVMTGWTTGAAALVGPALVGLLLAWSGIATAIAVMAGLSLLSTCLVANVDGPAAAVDSSGTGSDASGTGSDTQARNSADPSTSGVPLGPTDAADSIRAGALGNLVVALRNPQLRTLLVMHTFYFAAGRCR